MPSEAFIIRELTGSRRAVFLRNRALPYRPIAFPTSQHHIQHWYPGNRVATLQVLGPREGDVEIRGTWKSRFLADPNPSAGGAGVVLDGFDDIPNEDSTVTAEDLVEVFQRLRAAGNELSVRWGPEARRGILAKFDPTWLREEDVEWSATFVWSQRGDRPARRAAVRADPTADLRASIDDFDAQLAAEPPGLLSSVVGGIRGLADDLRRAAFAATVALTDIQTTATVSSAQFQNLQTLSARVLRAGKALKHGTLDLPYVDLLPFDEVAAIWAAVAWKTNVGASGRRVQAETVRSVASVARTAVPSVLATVVVRENETLRLLALQFYDNADAWPVIADANNLVGSDVAPGTVLVIPRAPQSASAAAVGGR